MSGEFWSTFNPLWITAVIAAIAAAVTAGIWVGRVNSDRESFKGFMREIRDKLDRIFERLPPPVVASGSPLKLTELGRRIAEHVGASAIAEELTGSLLESARGMSPYDIQQLCFDHLDDFEPPEELAATLKQCAFDNGIRQEDVKRVIAVVLRDRLLERSGP